MPRTSTGESVSATEPLYIAKYITNEADREKIIVATESEVLQSGQTWDMTPLIFYRVARPAFDLNALPCLDLDLYYPRGLAAKNEDDLLQNNNNLDE